MSGKALEECVHGLNAGIMKLTTHGYTLFQNGGGSGGEATKQISGVFIFTPLPFVAFVCLSFSKQILLLCHLKLLPLSMWCLFICG